MLLMQQETIHDEITMQTHAASMNRTEYWNKAKFLLASRDDKPPFAQTRCAQTERSLAAASAKLVTKLAQGSRICPAIDPAVF